MGDAIPLVDVTLTTDELAMCSAGLIQLRRFWAARHLNPAASPIQQHEALETVSKCTALLTRLEEQISPEQVKDLMQGFIQDRINRGD